MSLRLGFRWWAWCLRAQSLNLRTIVDSQSAHGMRAWNIFGGLQTAGLLYLPDGGVCGDESRAVRPAGGRNGACSRVSHRVQLDEVCDVLHGGVRQHDHGKLRGDAALLRRRVEPAGPPVAGLRRRGLFMRSCRSSGSWRRSSRFSSSTSGFVRRCLDSVTTS